MTNEIKKIVIPVAGFGTRMLPITKAIAKEFLPIVDKPSIHYVIEEALSIGIENIIFITSKGKEAIENYFSKNTELDYFLEKKGKKHLLGNLNEIQTKINIATVRQKEVSGLGNAIYSAKPFIHKDEFFAVILPDEVLDGPESGLKQMYQVFKEIKSPLLSLHQVKEQETNQYGIVDGKFDSTHASLFKINNLIEKPEPSQAPSQLAITGRYILKGDIFDFIEKVPASVGGEIQITDALREYVLQGNSLFGLKVEGTRYDMGNKLDFIRANIAFGLKREEFREPILQFLKKDQKNRG